MPHTNEAPVFFPRGAIAFFLVMVLFYVGLWFAMYFLMTHRG